MTRSRRLHSVIDRSADAGLGVVLDMHNYGAYYLQKDGRGVRRPIGSNDVSVNDFADAWRRISKGFGGRAPLWVTR